MAWPAGVFPGRHLVGREAKKGTYNMKQIDFGGKVRPVAFSTRMAFEYETLHGRSFQNDLFRLSLSNAAMEAESATTIAEDKTPNVVIIAHIIDAALRAGALRDKQPIDWNIRDVVGWMDDYPEAVPTLIAGVYNVLPRADEKEQKKTQVTTAAQPMELA